MLGGTELTNSLCTSVETNVQIKFGRELTGWFWPTPVVHQEPERTTAISNSRRPVVVLQNRPFCPVLIHEKGA